ncbi:MAG: transglycosylase domain-containing protein [Rhodomicrobiaceae bacterium]
MTFKPMKLPPLSRATYYWVAFREYAERLRHYGFLSASVNALIIFSLGTLAMLTSLGAPVSELYPLEKTLRPAENRPLVMLAANGQPFAKRGDCVADAVTLKELPPHLIDAVLAMEDRRFYSHWGVDPIGITRAALRNYEAGTIRQGGSTITQQLVKMSYLSGVKSFDRKAQEALLSLWLEIRLGKNEILERYLSSAYFGEGCYGVRAAAAHFFGKPVGELSIPDSAFLVALLSSPTQLANNFDDARSRAKLVLQAMVDDGRLERQRLATIAPITLSRDTSKEHGGYYADWLAGEVRKDLAEPRSRQPVPIYTTFEPGLQQMAEDAVRDILVKRGKRAHASQAALVAMRTDGRVLAMVGGMDHSLSQFNRAVQAKRQPGSAFKTFVYLALLRAGGDSDMLISDQQVSIDGWEPANYRSEFRGTLSLTQAFASSINTIAAKIGDAIGPDAVVRAARDLGIASPLTATPSIALGSYEVNLLEITSAYASIAAGVYPVKPWGVKGLGAQQVNDGEPPRDAGIWKLRHTEEMRDLLRAVVRRGTGKAARLRVTSYGKTGTSQDYRDAWFIGFSGNLVVGVWVGNDDDSPMRRVTGGDLPAQIWAKFMRSAIKEDPGFERKLPEIPVFAARSQEPAEDFENYAAIDSLEAPAVFIPREATNYEHRTTRGAYEYDDRPTVRRAPNRRSTVSRNFQERLNDMGWPGGR